MLCVCVWVSLCLLSSTSSWRSRSVVNTTSNMRSNTLKGLSSCTFGADESATWASNHVLTRSNVKAITAASFSRPERWWCEHRGEVATSGTLSATLHILLFAEMFSILLDPSHRLSVRHLIRVGQDCRVWKSICVCSQAHWIRDADTR